jgi:hypothetical protein
MNAKLTVEFVASEWTSTSADNHWSRIAAVRETAKQEEQPVSRKLHVMRQENSLAAPLRRSGAPVGSSRTAPKQDTE